MPFRVRSKACPRCGGDLSLERDSYGNYIECIQCGAFWSESAQKNPLKKPQHKHQPAAAVKVLTCSR